MWLELNSTSEDGTGTTWIDLSKAYAVTISGEKATISIGGEKYEASSARDVEQIQNWLLRKNKANRPDARGLIEFWIE